FPFRGFIRIHKRHPACPAWYSFGVDRSISEWRDWFPRATPGSARNKVFFTCRVRVGRADAFPGQELQLRWTSSARQQHFRSRQTERKRQQGYRDRVRSSSLFACKPLLNTQGPFSHRGTSDQSTLLASKQGSSARRLYRRARGRVF